MEMFSNLMEIWSPSSALKEAIKNPVVEVGSEIPLRSIDGQIFNCFILVPTKTQNGTLARCKYILAITNTQIIEMYPHSSRTGVVVVSDVHPLEALVKLKFKKGDQGILLLEYKNGKISKLLMEDPAVCVGHIKTKMKDMGINGSVRNKNEKIIENAQGFFAEAKSIETQFSFAPSVEYVQEMMDLLRKSAEKFAEANDDSFLDVMSFIKKFLQRSDVSAVLDSSMSYPQIPHTDPDVAVSSNIHELMDINSAYNMVYNEAPATPTHTTTTNIDSLAFSTPPSTSHNSLSDYTLSLPDVETELHTLQNALTYQFDEDDHHYTPHYDTHVSSPPSHIEKCELTDMLDSMTNELDTLLNSFSESSEHLDAQAGETVGDNAISAGTNEPTEPTDATTSQDKDFDFPDSDFLEFDFAQTLEEMVNAK